MDLRIYPPEQMIEATIDLPESKSMLNRAMIMDALSESRADMCDVDVCDDTSVMAKALNQGAAAEINVGAAGTAMRFLTAYYAATPGTNVTIDGCERMRQRPIGLLVDALRQCGAEIDYLGSEGFPPLHIRGQRLHGGQMKIDATVSSQFVSALLMVAPTFCSDLDLTLEGEASSRPYLEMTLAMMRHRGIDCSLERDEIHVTPGKYQCIGRADVERDWSAASYWYSVAALSAGWITLPGLTLPSLQGDSKLAEIFEKLGVITETADQGIELSASPEVYSRLEADLADTPDIAQTLVVTCCMVGIPFTLTGLASLRIKETDRLEALRAEADKIGCSLEIKGDDTIKWDGRRHPIFGMPAIDTYGDHRMAMAFAPAALYIPGMIIKDVEVVSKSYPKYWDDLAQAGFTLMDAREPQLEPLE